MHACDIQFAISQKNTHLSFYDTDLFSKAGKCLGYFSFHQPSHCIFPFHFSMQNHTEKFHTLTILYTVYIYIYIFFFTNFSCPHMTTKMFIFCYIMQHSGDNLFPQTIYKWIHTVTCMLHICYTSVQGDFNGGYFIMITWTAKFMHSVIINIQVNQVCIMQCYLHSPLFPSQMNTNYSCASIHFARQIRISLLCSVRTDVDGLVVKDLSILKGIVHTKLKMGTSF